MTDSSCTFPDTPAQRWLAAHGACQDARLWVADQALSEAWRACERGDWMLWLAAETGEDHKHVVKVVCAAARCALPVWEAYYPQDDCLRACIETIEQWTRGEAPLLEVRAARTALASRVFPIAADAAANATLSALIAAYAAAASAAAYAADAAYAAAAVYAAAYAAYAAYAAAYVAVDAADAAADAADVARAEILRQIADLCRAEWPRLAEYDFR